MEKNLQIFIFDVDHGFCGFIKDPGGHTMMIDCGGKEYFSPAKFIREYLVNDTLQRGNHYLTKLIITHPHEDHISDVHNLLAHLRPSMIKRQKIETFPKDKFDHNNEAFKKYKTHLDEHYNSEVVNPPMWEIERTYFRHHPSVACEIDDAKAVNNSSIVSIFKFGGRKIVFAGDVEEKGWEKHLEDKNFRNAIHGCDIYITPHHGHESGFSAELFNAMGKPLINIASLESGDESVDSRYSSDDYSQGHNVFDGEKNELVKLLTTRKYGNILIDIDKNGLVGIGTFQLADNLKQNAR